MSSRRSFLRQLGLVAVAPIVLPTDELVEQLTHRKVFPGYGPGGGLLGMVDPGGSVTTYRGLYRFMITPELRALVTPKPDAFNRYMEQTLREMQSIGGWR